MTFSQINGCKKWGFIRNKVIDDPQLYDEIYNEARRLIRISDEVRLSVEKISEAENGATESNKEPEPNNDEKGHCIRCNTAIALDPYQRPIVSNAIKAGNNTKTQLIRKNFAISVVKNIRQQ